MKKCIVIFISSISIPPAMLYMKQEAILFDSVFKFLETELLGLIFNRISWNSYVSPSKIFFYHDCKIFPLLLVLLKSDI